MKRSLFLAALLSLGFVSLAQGQESRPVRERPESRESTSTRNLTGETQAVTVPGAISRETQAAAPRLVKLSGALTEIPAGPESSSLPLEMTFALYNEELGGEALWTEIQNVEVDRQGRYTVLLGATLAEGLPVELFPSGEPRWLSVEIQGQPQQPRALLVGVPYALKALDSEKLGGKPASDFVSSADLSAQVRQVMHSQSEGSGQATWTGTLQPGQTKTNSTVTPQVTAAGPMFPPSTFSGTNSTQIVSVRQNGSGNGLWAQTASSTGNSGVVGVATSTSTSNNQNGVIGFNAGAGSGVAGIATNPAGGLGVYGQSANFAGVFGNAVATSGFSNGVYGQDAASCGFCNGVYGHNLSPNGNGVYGISDASSGYANGVFGQNASPTGVAVFGNDASGQATGVYGQTVNGVGVGGAVTGNSGSPAYGVWGDSAGTNGAGVAGFEDATSGFTYGVFGQSVSPDGTGVLGFNSSTGGIGVRGVANAAGNTRGVVGESSSSGGSGIVGVNHASSGGNAVNGFAEATTGDSTGVMGTTLSTDFGAGVSASAVAPTGNAFGLFGQVASPAGDAVFGHASSPSGGVGVVGFTEGTNSVAGQFVARAGSGLILQGLSGPTFSQIFSLDASGNLHIAGNLLVDGTKSSTAKLQSGREVALYAVESTENWFEDFGSAELRGGVAWVPLEAAFGEATNATVSYHVFLTPNGDSNGLYVARKTATGFEVREHAGGGSNVAFDYRIVVRRRGYETLRMADVQHDVKTLESSRQHLTQLANSGNLRKPPLAPLVPQAVPPHATRPIAPRPSAPQIPKMNVPQLPRGNK